MVNNKEQYRNLCEKEKSIPIFSQAWWLDAVCGEESWDVALIEKGGAIVAALPYRKNKKYGFRTLTMPQLTQSLGPWLKYPEHQKYSKRLAYEKELHSELIALLPAVDLFSQSFHYSVKNWLPFYWKGFSETTRYTYVLENIREVVLNDFQSNIKTDIKKAEKNISVYCENDIKKFYEINKLTFKRQNMSIPYSLEFLKELDKILEIKSQRIILFAEDKEQRIHAAIYVIWDNNSAYYLMGGGNPELRSSGATSLLIWEAIKLMKDKTNKFDFEGSMIEPVERFFRGFGAKQISYFAVTKVSRKLKVCYLLRDLLKTIVKG